MLRWHEVCGRVRPVRMAGVVHCAVTTLQVSKGIKNLGYFLCVHRTGTLELVPRSLEMTRVRPQQPVEQRGRRVAVPMQSY